MFLVGMRNGASVDVPMTTANAPPTVRDALKLLPRYGEPGNDTACPAKVTSARKPVLRRSPFAGMLFNGQLYRGHFGIAGEFGHMQVVPAGHRCECGNRGCWEQYASGNALVREARELGGKGLARRERSLEPRDHQRQRGGLRGRFRLGRSHFSFGLEGRDLSFERREALLVGGTVAAAQDDDQRVRARSGAGAPAP